MSQTRSTVFGLDVVGDRPLSFLRGASATATGRTVELSEQSSDGAALRDVNGFELVCEQLGPNGMLNFRIEAHPEAGYLVWGPRYGTHLLSTDGQRLTCAPDGAAEEHWQRLLVAQILPFAAVLNGLEVLHASAIVIDGRAVAFAGPSGSGKTSVALELCQLGADFLADDVLAMERSGSALLGHPGSPVAGLDHAGAQRTPRDLAAADLIAVNPDELLVGIPTVAAPARLSALFLLDRRRDGPSQPRFEQVAEAKTLLGATFNFVLTTPWRLRGLLDACALLSQRRLERVVLGPSVDASRLALAIRSRLG